VRKAANYAINRAEMVDMLGGVAMECYGVFTPSQAFYGTPIKFTHDPKKAATLLKEANCLPCNITIGISTSGSGQMQPLPMNELAKAQLEAAGFKVKFEVMDWNTLLATFWAGWEKNPNVDAINVSLSVLDPVSGFLKHFTTSNRGPVGLNWGWYQNREIDALADKVQATFDEAERKESLQTMLPVRARQIPVDQRIVDRPADEAVALETLVGLSGPVRDVARRVRLRRAPGRPSNQILPAWWTNLEWMRSGRDCAAAALDCRPPVNAGARRVCAARCHDARDGRRGRWPRLHRARPQSACALAQAQGLRSGPELVPGHDADRRVRDDELSLAPWRDFSFR
jgi:Bacterial extracellular solute-binding proteins, family 5 Middle